MQEREVQARLDEEQKIKDLELAKIAEAEKPPPDTLYGMRVHCWVLVLAGRREVGSVFIKGKHSVVRKRGKFDFNHHFAWLTILLKLY